VGAPYTKAEHRLFEAVMEVCEEKNITVSRFCEALAPVLGRTPKALMVYISKLNKQAKTLPPTASPPDVAAGHLSENRPSESHPFENLHSDSQNGTNKSARESLREFIRDLSGIIPSFLEEDILLDEPDFGEIIDVEVKDVRPYGAIVSEPKTGWRGLLHISEISYRHIDDVSKYVQPGQRIKVVVIRSPDGRKACSLKRLPWALKGWDVVDKDPRVP